MELGRYLTDGLRIYTGGQSQPGQKEMLEALAGAVLSSEQQAKSIDRCANMYHQPPVLTEHSLQISEDNPRGHIESICFRIHNPRSTGGHRLNNNHLPIPHSVSLGRPLSTKWTACGLGKQ